MFSLPSRKCDTKLILNKVFWCEFWWEEKIMRSNTHSLYRFSSDLRFYYEGIETKVEARNLEIIRKAYADWLLEKELLGRVVG